MGRDVLVVGGGIAGLATARALVAVGDRVTVVEQAPRWAPLGAGIVLARNAMAVLDHLGVGTAVRDAGRAVPAASILDAGGAPLLPVTGEAAHVAVHRADLHDALRAELGADLRLGTTVDSLRPAGRRIAATLSDGSGLDADLVVGADGIRSRVRALLLGADAPRVVDAGYRAWRLVTDHAIGLDGAVEQWGRGQRVGLVPLPAGRCYAFFVDSLPIATAGEGAVAGLRRRFNVFGGPAGRLLAALPDDTTLLEHPIEALDRVAYGRGAVVLVGDAAHAMTPNLGQGAAQALEDVPALVGVLDGGTRDAAERLARLRRRRATAVTRRSAAAGRIGQLVSPRTVAVRDRVLRAVPAALASRQVDAVTAHDPIAAALRA